MKLIIAWVKRYQILFCFFLAFFFAKMTPALGTGLEKAGMLNVLIAAMFFCIGITFDKSKIGNIFTGKLLVAILWALTASAVLGPVIGYYIATSLHFSNDQVVGIVLICVAPPTLVAGPIMAKQLGANFEISTAMSTIVKLVSLFIIPSIINAFLHKMTSINQLDLLKEMVYFLVLPGVAGQLVRMYGTRVVLGLSSPFSWIIAFLNFALAYIAFSSMGNELAALDMTKLLTIACPCLFIHLTHIIVTARIAKHALKIDRKTRIALTITACQKNMAIPLAIWSMSFIKTHPAAILVVVIYYLVQFLLDSSFLYCATLFAPKMRQTDCQAAPQN